MIKHNKKDKTWIADIRIKEKRIRKKGFLSKEIAESWVLQKRLKSQKKDAGLEVKDDIEIQEVFRKYLENSKRYKKPKTAKREDSSLGIWKRYFSENGIIYAYELSESSTGNFIAWRKFFLSSRGSEVSNRTINIDLEVLYRCINWAMDEKILSINTLRTPKKLKQARPGLPRYFSLEEIAKISEEAKKDTKKTFLWEAFQILIRTGIRAGELCSLIIADVDFFRKALIVRPEISKAGMLRIVPIDDNTKEIFEKMIQLARGNNRNYLFCTHSGERQTVDNLTRRFSGLLKNLRIDANLHVCRKTFISWRIMAGCDPVKVMAWVGHSEWATMKRYMALSPKYLESSETMPY